MCVSRAYTRNRSRKTEKRGTRYTCRGINFTPFALLPFCHRARRAIAQVYCRASTVLSPLFRASSCARSVLHSTGDTAFHRLFMYRSQARRIDSETVSNRDRNRKRKLRNMTKIPASVWKSHVWEIRSSCLNPPPMKTQLNKSNCWQIDSVVNR